jgi:hypothetical protein
MLSQSNEIATRMTAQSTNFQGQARRQPKYAFFHAEGPGYLHVDVLGDGAQGTATLVRNATSGELIVRKRSLPPANDEEPFADQFCVNHPNVVQLRGFQNYRDAEGKWSSATYWPYANDNNLASLCKRYRLAGKPMPEVLIWQALCHMLKAHDALHMSGKSHRDGHSGNVFVHWDGTSTLPDFILGDLGFCRDLQDGVHTWSEDIDLEDPDLWKRNDATNQNLDRIYGEPTLSLLYHYDENEISARVAGTTLELFCIHKSLLWIGSDMSDISACLSLMMNEMDFDEEYSEELCNMAHMIYNLETFARSLHVRTLPRWQKLMIMVRYAAESGLANAITSSKFPVQGLESYGPAPAEGRPVMFDSAEALFNADSRPPGPWYVAAVDPDTLRVIGIDQSRSYCDDDAMCTDAKGWRVFSDSDGSSMDVCPIRVSKKEISPCHCRRPHDEK